jgi:hypothetical protein
MMTERDELVLEGEYESQPIDEPIVESIITFMYTGTLPDMGGELPSVLALATYLQIDEVVQICCEQLRTNLDEDNCLRIWEWANVHINEGSCWKRLHDACQEYVKLNIEANFGEIKMGPSPASISPTSSPLGTSPNSVSALSPSKFSPKKKLIRKRKTAQHAKLEAHTSDINTKISPFPESFLFTTSDLSSNTNNTNNNCSKNTNSDNKVFYFASESQALHSDEIVRASLESLSISANKFNTPNNGTNGNNNTTNNTNANNNGDIGTSRPNTRDRKKYRAKATNGTDTKPNSSNTQQTGDAANSISVSDSNNNIK